MDNSVSIRILFIYFLYFIDRMNVNMLLYWMYVVRLNAPQRCAWQKKKRKKKINQIVMELFFVAFVQRHLAKLMRMSVRRKRLRHDAMLLHYTDMAMMREGVETMTDFELERVSLNCRFKG